MRPLGSKYNGRAPGRGMKLEGWLEVQLTKHNVDVRTVKMSHKVQST